MGAIVEAVIFLIEATTALKLTSFGAFSHDGPLTRYVKLRIAHALGMPGTFSSPPCSNETAS